MTMIGELPNRKEIISDAQDSESNVIAEEYSRARTCGECLTVIERINKYSDSSNPPIVFEELVNSKPLGVATAAYWALVLNQIEELCRVKKTKDVNFEYAKVFGKFFGFLTAKIGYEPDAVWQRSLEFGDTPAGLEEQAPGYFIGTDEYEDVFTYPLGEKSFAVKVETSSSNGEISLLGADGQKQWTLEIPAVTKKILPRSVDSYTNWFEISPTGDRSKACFWGVSTYGMAYFVVFSVETGELIDKFYLEYPDRVFLRKRG
jgi:hypothetical protein